MFSYCVPALVRVNGNVVVVPSGWFPKLSVAGETTASGPAPLPTASKTCEPGGALSVKVTKVASGPTTDGTNPTSKAQLSPGGMGTLAHGCGPCSEKSALFGPARVMLEILKGASPVLYTATA